MLSRDRKLPYIDNWCLHICNLSRTAILFFALAGHSVMGYRDLRGSMRCMSIQLFVNDTIVTESSQHTILNSVRRPGLPQASTATCLETSLGLFLMAKCIQEMFFHKPWFQLTQTYAQVAQSEELPCVIMSANFGATGQQAFQISQNNSMPP